MKLPTTPKSPTARKHYAYLAALLTLGTVCAYGQATVQEPQTEAEKKAAAEKAAVGKQKQLTKDIKKESKDAAATGSDDEATIELDPFVVESDNSKGYQATSSMSGSRLNTKLDDIAASMTVVTKEQLNDFAALDINDIFAMEVGTEGSHTYTANTNTGGYDSDEVANNKTTANRVRGLGSANVAIGNFASSSTIPIDTYNIDAVEISRGPNSSIFGTGEVSGVVNLVPAAANMNKSFTKSSIMTSNRGTLRSTFDVNRPIFKNTLGIRVSAVAMNEKFERKPSYDKTRRLTLGATFRPHKNTTLRVSWEKFEEKYSRPNSVTPRNWMEIWEKAGRPSWDPINNLVTYSNGRVADPVIPDASTSKDPYKTKLVGTSTADTAYISTIFSNRVRSSMGVNQGGISYFNPTVWFVGPGYGAGNVRELTAMALTSNYGVPTQYRGGLGYSGILGSTDRNFYDYTSINLGSLNYGQKNAEILKAELEQYVLQTRMHMIAFQFGAYQEKITDLRRTFVGNGRDGVAYDIKPDVNRFLADGSANPNYGAPYISALAPQTYLNPIDNHTLKVNAVYQLDLSNHRSKWISWIGKQRLLGYKEYNERIYSPSNLRYVDQITSVFADKYVPTGASPTTALPNNDISLWLGPTLSARGANTIWNANYYLGDGSGNNIDFGSTAPKLGTIPYRRWGSSGKVNGVQSNSWNTDNVNVDTVYYAIGMQQNELRTSGFVWQGFFLNDRIVPTYGEREDKLRTRPNSAPASYLPYQGANGLINDTSYLYEFDNSLWNITNKYTGARQASGKTRTKGIVVKPFSWISLRYNESNSFKPETFAIDFEGNPLPNPYGQTKDYGVRFNLFRNKLSLGITKFKTVSVGSRSNSSVTTVASRLVTMDFDLDPAANGSKHDLQDWYYNELIASKGIDAATISPEDAAKYLAQTNQAIGLNSELIATLQSYDKAITTDELAKGIELEATYNPSKYWTMKMTGSKNEAITNAIGSSYQTYRDLRMATWTTIDSPNKAAYAAGAETRWWYQANNNLATSGGNPMGYYNGTVAAPMKLQLALQGKPKPQNRVYKANFMTNYRLAGITGQRILKDINIGGSARWEDKGAIGFYGAAADSDGIVRDYDANRPIYDKAHTYFDLFAGYDFRLFKGRIKSRLQLNVKNITENGRLQAYSANPDGSLVAYRIVDPREFVMTLSFDL